MKVASPEFYADKLRAMGVFEYCKDIIRNFNKPQDKIIKPSRGNFVGNEGNENQTEKGIEYRKSVKIFYSFW